MIKYGLEGGEENDGFKGQIYFRCLLRRPHDVV